MPNRAGLAWAVVDPWEIRGSGILAKSRSTIHAVRRLVSREKPTAIATNSAPLARLLRNRGSRSEPALIQPPIPALPLSIARDLYPEFAFYAPTRPLQRVTALAISAALHSPVTTRRYAHKRCRPSLHAA